MNHVYRLVWSHAAQAWIAVTEIARSRGKTGTSRPGRRAARALLALYGVSLVQWAQAASPTVVLESGQRNRAYVAGNGATVVDIANANASGISHNKFTQYDVGSKGVVLNNTISKSSTTSSQLAGSVAANLYSNKSASLIVNEVTSTRRSTLAGFTEVIGSKADVIVANPNGITCNGCGFINSGHVTLTTGTPQWGSLGALTALKVNGGDILISGTGANASAQQIFDLVTRSVKLTGAINAQTLGISTGAQSWNYATRTATATTPNAQTPAYAIDSSVLGGMYANSIRLIANENGVGVRMLGDAAAKTGDVIISAAGKVDLRNHASAARDIQIGSKSGVLLDDAQLIAKRTLNIKATDIAATDAILVAGENVSVASTTGALALTDTTLRATGAVALTAKGNLSVNANDDKGIESSAGDVTLKSSAQLLLAGNVAAARNASLNAASSISNTGLVQAGAALSLSGNGALDNQGTLLAGGALNAKANSLLNDGSMQGGTLNIATQTLANTGALIAANGAANFKVEAGVANTGLLQAKTGLNLSNAAGAAVTQVDNQGQLVAGGALSLAAVTMSNQADSVLQGGSLNLTAQSFDNAGLLLALTGNATLTLSNALLNQSGANITAGGRLNIQAASAHNLGLLASTGNMHLQTVGALENESQVVAGGVLQVTASALTNAAGSAMQGNGLNLTLASLDNAGDILAKTGDASLTISGAVTNRSGANLGAAGNVDLQANGLSNAGLLASGDTMSLQTSGAFSNTASGNVISLTGLNLTSGGLVTNQGSMTAEGSAVITANGLSNTTNAAIRGAQGLTIALGSSDLNNGGLLQAGTGAPADTAALSISAANLTTSATGSLEGGGLSLTATRFDNYGKLTAATGGSSIVLSNALNNYSTGVMTLGNADSGMSHLEAAAIANQGTLQTQGGMTLTSANLSNATGAKLLSGGDMNLAMQGAANITVDGLIETQGKLTVSGASTVDVADDGSIHSRALDISATALNLGKRAVLSSLNNLDIEVTNLSMQSDGADTSRILGAMDGTAGTRAIVTVNGNLDVPGLIYSGTDLSVTAGNINVGASGALAAANNLSLAAAGGVLDLAATTAQAQTAGAGNLTNLGLLYAGNTLAMRVNGTLTNAVLITGSGAGRTLVAQGTILAEQNIEIVANTLINNSDIMSDGDLRIIAATLRNEVQGGDTRRISSDNNPALDNVAAEHPDDRDLPPPGWIHKPGDSVWDDGGAGGVNDEARNVVRYYTVTTAFDAGTEPLYWPTITATGNAKLYFNVGKNLGGLIQGAQSVLLQGFAARTSAGNGTVLSDLSSVQDAAGHVLVQPEALAADMAVFTNNSLAQLSEVHTVQRTQTDKDADGDPWSWCTLASDDVCNGYNGNWTRGSKNTLDYVSSVNPILPAGYSGARVYTASLSGSGFTIYNEGSTTPAAFDPGALQDGGTMGRRGVPGITLAAPSSTLPGTGTQTGWTPVNTEITPVTVVGVDGKTLQTGLSFGGINVKLPTNSNGLYVQTKDPSADYLIERNPLYGTGASIGSDYLFALLGFNSDELQKRLGDDSYEAWLIRQQLIAQTGSMLLKGYSSADEMMKALLQNAAAQSKALGLTLGTALTPEQQAGLKSDVVWMVKTTVNGQEVLSPVLYLSQETKNSIQKGAIIQAEAGGLTVQGKADSGTINVNIDNKGGRGVGASLANVGVDQSYAIVKSYLLSAGNGTSIGIDDPKLWLEQNRNNPDALGKVMPYAYQRFVSLAQGGGIQSDSDRAFVSAVAEYAKAERIKAIDKALAEYASWKKGPKLGETRGLMTSLFNLGESPPDHIMKIAESGVTWKSDQEAAAIGAVLLSSIGGAAAAGGATAAVGTAGIYSSVAIQVARGLSATIGAVGGVAAAAASFAAAAAIAGQAIAKLVNDKNFEKKLHEMKAEYKSHSATDFNYWLSMEGGDVQMALSMTKMMSGV